MHILALNGPNLNRLGTREPEIYGSDSYQDLEESCQSAAAQHGVTVDVRQTNAEHQLLEWLHQAADSSWPVVLNPAAWTHTSIAIRDACAALTAPLIEVHLTNIHAREEFRAKSYISPIATGVIAGLGISGYALAIQWLAQHPAR